MRLKKSPAVDVAGHILIVEDDPAHAEAIKRVFQSGDVKTEIQVVGTLREYREQVTACPPDIAIMDLNLPDGRSVEVLTSPPESGLFPVVVMTAFGNEQVAVAAMKLGALDYIVKSPEVLADMPHIVERVRREWELLQERKRMEAAVIRSKKEWERTFDTVPDLTMLTDLDYRIIRLNKPMATRLGSTPQQLVGRSCYEVVHGLSAPPDFCPHVKMIASGNEERAEYFEKHLKGTFDVIVTPLRDEAGEFVGSVHVAHDITERKQADEERKNLLEQLVRSEKLAAVGELISGVAHEINNPLTGILGLSELLLLENKDNLNEDTKKDLKSIYESSERIKKIVANLLRFARKEAPVKKDTNINELLDTVLNIRSYEMKVRNVELKKNYQPDLPLVIADSSQLEQVFLNLIVNAEYAIHAKGKAGTLTITTSLQEKQPEDQKVIIEIADTGAGIPENVLTKIFNPFFTTKPAGEGTGLGLSVSYGIIKEHGGEIGVRNQTEGGAVFIIELPVRGG